MSSTTGSKERFHRLLHKYITFRGIDIVLHLHDGTIVELDKNRYIDNDYIIKKNARQQIEQTINIDDIRKADFYAS
jgi:ribosomal protein S4E